MTHVFLVTEAVPGDYPNLLEWMRNLEYPYEGGTGTGIQKPFIREIRFFDVNVKREAMEPFLGDIKNLLYEGIRDNQDPLYDMSKAHFSRGKMELFRKAMSVITPLKYVNMDKIKARKLASFPAVSFAYAQVLGYLNDPIIKRTGTELM